VAAELRERGDLEERLGAIVATATGAWPGLRVTPEAFVAHLGARLARAEALDVVAAADLYLACACLAREEAAVRALDESIVEPLDSVLRRIGAPPEVSDEVLQRLREALLVGRPDRPPEIGDYAGRGPLRAWLRVMAVREATRALQKRRRDAASEDDALVDALCPDPDPALAIVKQVHRRDLARALSAALESLPARDRTLLRHHLVDGLSSEQIGALHGVHRVTVTRWINKVRATLLSRMRKALTRELGISGREAESLMHLVQSQVDVSLERILGPGDDE
jgi:RNA polymerase sigma-70 factor (ECF subfamily)